ncbi:SRPBCC family protein [Jatrophihabitans endophyticus]|uniref:SRPBCC family protein n=1 Tax=Jatrophihabitans endophyticus TaxID=1206085 RepID=UPI0019DFCA85|nr:SRPBCC family protein [Jatrophihabitans endophyticus]MBE7188917.1 SRPBCC family protein [Jatrophihabitans endophyticus]
MTTVSRSFTVTPDPKTVVDYLADFGHAEEWDPGTETCTRNDSGPIAVGANWHNKSKIAGLPAELTYTLTELTDNRVVLVGKNDSATATEIIEVEPDGSGSRVTYTNELEMHGAAKLATPAMKLVFEKLGNDTEKQLTEVLNGLSG